MLKSTARIGSLARPSTSVGSGKPAASGDPRSRILAAAFRVVAERTINGTRMPTIAREAGVSQGTLHYYFDTKENLLLRLLDWLLEAFREYRGIETGIRIPPPGDSDAKAYRQTFVTYLRLLLEKEQSMGRVFYDFWIQAVSGPGPLQDVLRQQFQIYRQDVRSMLSPALRDGRRADVAAGLIVSLFEGAVLQLTLDGEAFHKDSYLTSVEQLITDVIDKPLSPSSGST